MWNIVNTVLGLDYLTPQGIRFGVAASLALSVLVPARSTTDVIVVNGSLPWSLAFWSRRRSHWALTGDFGRTYCQ